MAKKKQNNQAGGQQFLSPERYIREKARTLEIGTCYVTNDIDKMKLGHVIVTRRHTGGRISMACYLVDMACLGVKDSFFRLRMDDWEFDEFFSGRRDMFRECSYDEAHNRVWGSVAFAEEAGIAPDKSFQLTQYMLEEDTDDVPLIDYEYGKDGKHFLVCRTELEGSRYLPLLRKNLGEGNYEYIIGVGDPGFDDEEEEDVDEELRTVYDLPVAHVDMADIVNAKSTTEILCVSHELDIDINDIIDEAEMRRKYVDYILEHPEELLKRLPKNEMDLLLSIRANRSMAKGVPTPCTESLLVMEIAGVADAYWDNEVKYCIRVADDFQKVALPLATKVRMSEEVRRRYEVETIIGGMANLYGMVTLEDAKRAVMMDRGGFRSKAGRLIDEVMDYSLLLKCNLSMIDDTLQVPYIYADDNVVFSSRYSWDNLGDLRKAIATVGANVGGNQESTTTGCSVDMPTQPFTDEAARRFTCEEVCEAGSGDVPTIPNKRQEKFWNFLIKDLEWDDYFARQICFELWYKANHAEDPASTDEETIEKYFEEEALDFDGITQETRRKGLRLLADYVAHIPRWTLKGHAPAEMQTASA